ncbi:MAG: ATP-binding protein [Succinivibrio sp.]|jgi:AAA+ ATPase superfamily predicted ATPase|nr:ATP-binding protein [Succinivibrio sp.]
MRSKVIGRSEEWQRLEECMQAECAQLIVVYGRRRVGKTFLIEEFFDKRFAFKLTGAFSKPKEFQLRNFAAEYNRRTREKRAAPQDWPEAFELLRSYLSAKMQRGGKAVVFIDEMPWLDTMKSGFMDAFEWFWNDWAGAQDDLVFIVCGSATSWMINNFNQNKGGLFNRQTCQLYLAPLSLSETEMLLERRNIRWSRYEIAQAYMIMGGIPFYLNLLRGALSYSQNIDSLFFKKNGELHDEFTHLYQTLFSNSESYIKVVQALSEKTCGLTRIELAEKTGLNANGDLSEIIGNLIASGFVRVSAFYKKKKKGALYQLADYYTAFYFKYIKDHYGRDEHYWSNAIDDPARRAWAGLTFEQLCKDHIRQIKQTLGISGVLTEEFVWYTQGDAELGISGAQIDLVMVRRDRVANLCEMKYSINDFVIDKAYDAVLRNKLDAFRRVTGTRDSLQLTMITTYGVKKNKYSNLIQSEVTLDDLFRS